MTGPVITASTTARLLRWDGCAGVARRHGRWRSPALEITILVTLACCVLAACGGQSHTRDRTRPASAGFAPCPRSVNELGRVPARRGPIGPAIPSAPLAGDLCVYSTGLVQPSRPRLQWAAPLSQPRARTLALLLDSHGGRGPSCDVGYPVLIRLRYRTAGVLSALADGCDPELLRSPGGVRVMGPTASLAVGGLLTPEFNRGARLERVLDYIGLRFAIASATAGRRLSASGTGTVLPYELNDSGVPFGQVIWQIPLPGTEQSVGAGSVSLVVATRPASPCRSGQLLGHYEDGGNATQNHFGSIELLDTSSRSCSLSGRLALQGLSGEGRPDTESASEPVGPTIVLSPRATARAFTRFPPRALVATIGFGGNASMCHGRETVPRTWSLTLGTRARLRIANTAPLGVSGKGGPFYSCRGGLSFGLSPPPRILGS